MFVSSINHDDMDDSDDKIALCHKEIVKKRNEEKL